IKFDFEKVVSHLRQQAYLVKGLKISVLDLREVVDKIKDIETFYIRDLGIEAPSMTFYFDGGLISLIRFYNQTLKPLHKNIFYVEKQNDNFESVEVALQYTDDIASRVLPFANNIYNVEGGTHITGFKAALTRTLNNYAKKNNIIKESDDSFTGEDVLEGLTAVISIKLREIQFEGQTKGKLGSVEARGLVETVFSDKFSEFLEENPDDGRSIVNKVILALKARKAAKAAKDSVLRKGALEGMTLPGKLADCQSKSAEESELFIVEGDSAGGTAKTGRDRRIQAILPLRGKILNIERARLDRMLGSEQIKNLVVALGTAIGDTFDMAKLRYHKIIIASDADVDGAHIRTLFLTLMYRYFRPLIDNGFVYIAQPPLYKIKKGKEIFYAYTDEDKEKIVGKSAPSVDEISVSEISDSELDNSEQVESEKTKISKISIQRYKGLGEMNAEELWETTMDPAKRILKQVNIEDAQEADRIFDVLMGTDVPSRKSFIQSNAKYATIDI
ncbi:MAG: toprim domain-containing protein, partial [Patescibacteria group bacterium]